MVGLLGGEVEQGYSTGEQANIGPVFIPAETTPSHDSTMLVAARAGEKHYVVSSDAVITRNVPELDEQNQR